MAYKAHSFIEIVDARMSRHDLVRRENHKIMVEYCQHLLPGVMKASDLISCKEHRVGALQHTLWPGTCLFLKLTSEAAVLYLALVYEFWPISFISARGGRGKIKARFCAG